MHCNFVFYRFIFLYNQNIDIDNVITLWRDFRSHSFCPSFSVQRCFVLFLVVVVARSRRSSSLLLSSFFSLSLSRCLCSRLLSLCSLLRSLVLLSCLLLSLNNTLWYFSLPSRCPSLNFTFLFPRFIKEAVSWKAWKEFFGSFKISIYDRLKCTTLKLLKCFK